jgi:two-component system, NtrC family, response regulator AtoC
MASILIVDDEETLAEAYASFFEKQGHEVQRAATGGEAIARYRATPVDLVLLDVRLPDVTGFDVFAQLKDDDPVVIMISGHADIPLAVRAMQEGVENFLTKPVELTHLGVATERALERVRLRQVARYLTARRESTGRLPIGSSPRMRELAAQIELLAASDKTTVLLVGESGTGKGRLAELIHASSPRADKSFVEVNCAAIRGEALDEELFGAERAGRDSQVDVRPGLLEVADGGTLFVDEIGDLPAPLQSKLLRVLEGKRFRRLGGTREVTADVRIVAATNKDLVTEVNADRFREDLYYRLSVMPVYLPPLRSRSREDVSELIGRLVDELAPHLPASPRRVSDAALDRLLRYSWPGNIRELRNVLERGMIVARGNERIDVVHLPSEVRDTAAAASGTSREVAPLEFVEREAIERALLVYDGNRTHTARALGISRATLIKKIKDYGLAAIAR